MNRSQCAARSAAPRARARARPPSAERKATSMCSRWRALAARQRSIRSRSEHGLLPATDRPSTRAGQERCPPRRANHTTGKHRSSCFVTLRAGRLPARELRGRSRPGPALLAAATLVPAIGGDPARAVALVFEGGALVVGEVHLAAVLALVARRRHGRGGRCGRGGRSARRGLQGRLLAEGGGGEGAAGEAERREDHHRDRGDDEGILDKELPGAAGDRAAT